MSFQRRLVDQSSQLDGEMPTNSEGLGGIPREDWHMGQ